MVYASSPKLKMETFEVNSCIQGYHVFESIFGTKQQGRIELCTRKDKHRGYLRCDCDSAVVGHVPQKMSAACALFLRWRGTIRHDQLWLILFNTTDCHEEFASPRARACTYVHIACGWYASRHVYTRVSLSSPCLKPFTSIINYS